MNNFSRALRLAYRYKWTLTSLVFSAMAVAALWTANLGTIYPIVGVVLKQHSLRDWVDEGIESAEERSRTLNRDVAEFQGQLENADAPQAKRLRYEISKSTAMLQAEQRAHVWLKWAQPMIHRYSPEKPFPTLILVVAFLMAGTAIKTVFLITSVILVERLTQLASFDLRRQLYAKTLGMNLAHFGEERTATLLSHFTFDMECITTGIRTVFGRALRNTLRPSIFR